MRFDDEDEFEARANKLALLEGHTGPLEEMEGDVDELDVADQILGSGPDGHAGIEGKVSLRDQKWQGLNKVAEFRRINPPSVLQGVIGGQQTVLPGENKQVAFWGGEDAETLPVTVTFSPVDVPTDLNAAQNLVRRGRPYGIVKFGTRGMLVTAFVDIAKGIQFTVNASEVTLQVGCEPLDSPTSNPVPYPLSGMLSFYPTTHTAPVTRTVRLRDFGGGLTNMRCAIPPFARAVQVIPSYSTFIGNAPQTGLMFSTAGGTVTGAYVYPATVAGVPVIPQGFIPIPNGSDICIVTQGGPASIDVAVVFELAF